MIEVILKSLLKRKLITKIEAEEIRKKIFNI